MKPMSLIVAILSLWTCAGIAAADTASSRHANMVVASATAQEQSSIPQRWVADAPLRAGMQRVRKSVIALAPMESGHLTRRQVLALADTIQTSVNFIFANCRLDPEPDAALHPLLGRLLVASQALRDHPANPMPLADLRAVLARYAQLFEDSGLPAHGRQ